MGRRMRRQSCCLCGRRHRQSCSNCSRSRSRVRFCCGRSRTRSGRGCLFVCWPLIGPRLFLRRLFLGLLESFRHAAIRYCRRRRNGWHGHRRRSNSWGCEPLCCGSVSRWRFRRRIPRLRCSCGSCGLLRRTCQNFLAVQRHAHHLPNIGAGLVPERDGHRTAISPALGVAAAAATRPFALRQRADVVAARRTRVSGWSR